jgi:hypothetical protein
MVEAEAEKHGVHIVSIDEIFPGYFCEETKGESLNRLYRALSNAALKVSFR